MVQNINQLLAEAMNGNCVCTDDYVCGKCTLETAQALLRLKINYSRLAKEVSDDENND